MPTRAKVLTIVGWTVVWLMTAMLVFVFGAQGLAKFSATSGWATAFAHWGYPTWFRLTIGGLEILAALLLVWPRSAPLGAAIIVVVMLGGMGTHILKDGGRHLNSEVVPLTFATVILIARRRQLAGLIQKVA